MYPDSEPLSPQDEIRIGISACLLGEKVRYDGGHELDRFVTGTLAQFVRFVPVCPEVDIGLGTPSETLRLEKSAGRIRLVAPRSGADHTATMRAYAARRTRELGDLDLSGYILKKDSPSCGMERVRVYSDSGMPARSGRGLFAEALLQRHPLLPVEEEGRLSNPCLRDNFFVRVFAYRRLHWLLRPRWRLGDLVRFHTAEKLLLLSHDPAACRDLGRLVARARARPRTELARAYGQGFMTALGRMATTRKHCNVLQHIQGYFRGKASDADRRELAGVLRTFLSHDAAVAITRCVKAVVESSTSL